MRLTVLGPTGRIGRLVVEQALEAGHDVTVLARRRDAFAASAAPDRLRVVTGDATDLDAVSAAVDRADAVISALGP
ncbi:MAG: NAD(P)H-binding protein, partial [Chloroflexota bacterium]|nr:NAD(P)H-binding protein [Chloroflexota bacterium]